jgi:hypothetical protein
MKTGAAFLATAKQTLEPMPLKIPCTTAAKRPRIFRRTPAQTQKPDEPQFVQLRRPRRRRPQVDPVVTTNGMDRRRIKTQYRLRRRLCCQRTLSSEPPEIFRFGPPADGR